MGLCSSPEAGALLTSALQTRTHQGLRQVPGPEMGVLRCASLWGNHWPLLPTPRIVSLMPSRGSPLPPGAGITVK